MNWGKGLAIGYISFALFLGYMVYLTTTIDPELVATDYYAREIAFQDKIDARELAKKNGAWVKLIQVENGLQIQFNEEVSNVIIEMQRPADSKLDRDFQFGNDRPASSFLIVEDDLTKGQYSLAIDWKKDANIYYHKQAYFYK